ncbi:MAG: GTPase, partial [Sedimentisphaerales bacterium]|nr:GTPase [Sedimentisphaerales bacterium]
IKTESLEQIQKEAAEILKVSEAAQYIIHGCKVVLAGPANSGKSTLLNCLVGKDKSIVADIPGTTRDWVSAHCIIGPLAMEIIDTAGLDESLTPGNAIDEAAQKRSVELVRQADVVIWVIDGSDEKTKIKDKKLKIKNQILVINKYDLGLKADNISEDAVVISAKNGTGIEELTKKIRVVLGVEGFDLKQAVCFTQRQKQLLQKIAVAKDSQSVQNALAALW